MTIRQVTPMIAVADVADAVAFFRDRLGFRPGVDAAPDYAYLTRDGGAIRLLAAPPGADMDDEAREVTAYVDLPDIAALEALWAEVSPRLAGYRTRAPFDQAYGQREFHVIYGPLLIFFGAPIPPDPPSEPGAPA